MATTVEALKALEQRKLDDGMLGRTDLEEEDDDDLSDGNFFDAAETGTRLMGRKLEKDVDLKVKDLEPEIGERLRILTPILDRN